MCVFCCVIFRLSPKTSSKSQIFVFFFFYINVYSYIILFCFVYSVYNDTQRWAGDFHTVMRCGLSANWDTKTVHISMWQPLSHRFIFCLFIYFKFPENSIFIIHVCNVWVLFFGLFKFQLSNLNNILLKCILLQQ